MLLGGGGVSSEVKMKWRDRWIYATLEPAGMCPLMSENGDL